MPEKKVVIKKPIVKGSVTRGIKKADKPLVLKKPFIKEKYEREKEARDIEALKKYSKKLKDKQESEIDRLEREEEEVLREFTQKINRAEDALLSKRSPRQHVELTKVDIPKRRNPRPPKPKLEPEGGHPEPKEKPKGKYADLTAEEIREQRLNNLRKARELRKLQKESGVKPEVTLSEEEKEVEKIFRDHHFRASKSSYKRIANKLRKDKIDRDSLINHLELLQTIVFARGIETKKKGEDEKRLREVKPLNSKTINKLISLVSV
jgi:hypothetical protein